jgi:hypothetical protein
MMNHNLALGLSKRGMLDPQKEPTVLVIEEKTGATLGCIQPIAGGNRSGVHWGVGVRGKFQNGG